jgi:O-antigen ligase
VYADNLRGPLGGSDGLGLLIGITWPLLAVTVDRRWSHPVAGFLALAAPATVVALSTARNGTIALMLGIVLYELGRSRWLRAASRLALVVAAVAIVVVWNPQLVSPQQDAAARAFATKEQPTPPPSSSANKRSRLLGSGRAPGESLLTSLLGGRDEAWSAVVRLADRRPLTGYGYGTGDRLFDRYPNETHFVYFSGASAVRTNAHSGYMQAFEELGWAGGAVFLLPLLLAGAAGLRGTLRSPVWDDSGRALAAALVAGLFGGLFESVFQSAGGAFSLLIWTLASATLRAREWEPAV